MERTPNKSTVARRAQKLEELEAKGHIHSSITQQNVRLINSDYDEAYLHNTMVEMD